MKKINLLTLGVLSSVASIQAGIFDSEYSVIKDGKLAEGVTVVEYDPSIIIDPNTITEGVAAPDGSIAAQYNQVTQDGKNLPDVKLAFANPVDLSKNYILYIEYMIPGSHAEDLICAANKPLFMFGFAADAETLDAKGINDINGAAYIDAKYGVTDQWVKAYKYVFVNPSVTSLAGMILSYSREYTNGDLTEFPLIKNLSFIQSENGVKPFYAENFRLSGDTWTEEPSISSSRKFKATDIAGGIKPEPELEDDFNKVGLFLFRAYEAGSTMNQDGSGYIDGEHFHAMEVKSAYTGNLLIKDIPLPAGIQEIHSEMLIKMNPKDGDLESAMVAPLPIKFAFNTGEEVAMTENVLDGMWKKETATIAVPAGATSVTLKFGAIADASYLVDDIILSSAEFNNVEEFMAENNAFEVNAYVDANGNIVVLNGELEAVYNMNGVVASENDKVVVILVKNAEGQKASKLMIRK